MCKRNSPYKNKVNMGCVRETTQIKMKLHRMLKRDSADKNENSTGCVRETPQINIKPARDV